MRTSIASFAIRAAGAAAIPALIALIELVPPLRAFAADSVPASEPASSNAVSAAKPASDPAAGSVPVQNPAAAEVGKAAPDFTLKDTEGREHTLRRYLAQGKTVVLEWFNPDCPFVRRHHEKEKTMDRTFEQYKGKDVVWLAINSSAPGKQGYGLERNIQARGEYHMQYPILLDDSGRVGRMYGAKTTPSMYVIRKDGTLVYAGAIDDDPRGTSSKRVNYVDAALKQCSAGKDVATSKTDSYGCSVKYGESAPGGKPGTTM